MSNLKVAEGQSFAAVRGEVPTRDVVDAIMTAEQSLQTASRHPRQAGHRLSRNRTYANLRNTP
jgi:hypothetical protein